MRTVIILGVAAVLTTGCTSDTALKPPAQHNSNSNQAQLIQNDPHLPPNVKAHLLAQAGGSVKQPGAVVK